MSRNNLCFAVGKLGHFKYTDARSLALEIAHTHTRTLSLRATSTHSGVAWGKLQVGPAGGGSKNFVFFLGGGAHGECGKERKGPTFEKFSGELTSRSLLLEIMSIITYAVMAVCWLDRSAIISKVRAMA